ncbi:MAG: potassium-transporting ATPase subunit B [Candidatus Melainabacteria bacterium RIFCSPLOWO2_02_FULL_35_15]|nr:MAG: potassium-transporting ATPase subunit B [Candidatus Melainabacteria bacterium RIFCSPLOWO2_12_FULL_35_11]OGI12901.1 MAG: potassium-transporting ATPase subunit B [Candidatus Melainabacteria bacterium RIFCSPLOWO2_02_FULL_35_15]
MDTEKTTIWESKLFWEAFKESFIKLNPFSLRRNIVMLVVEIGSIITTVVTVQNIINHESFSFNLQITLWLWFTILFANFAESLAEGRSKAQARSLQQTRIETFGNRLSADGTCERVSAMSLRKGDIVLVCENEIIPGDGEIVHGAGLIDESAITGESAAVLREAGSDRDAVTIGTRIISGKIKVKITADPGNTFLDHMIAMVESAHRQKTPSEVALEILLIGLTVVFLVVTITLIGFAGYLNIFISVTVLISLLVCLMPTTIGGLLPAIGIAGMERLVRNNVIAISGRAIEASGDVDIVLLDKTGTITLGNRIASDFIPDDGIDEQLLAETALLSSIADETPEGRSIVTLAKNKLGVRGKDIQVPEEAIFVPFSVHTRMSGLTCPDGEIRKGAYDAIEKFIAERQGVISEKLKGYVEIIAKEGGTPLVVARGGKAIGVIYLKDIIKHGIKERLSELRKLGIRSVMITGDNPLTASTIARESGVDDFIAEAKPEIKLQLIREYQSKGYLVAMIGDGTNDAPALAQADVGIAMNAGTQAAREASNMVDLDSNPTKVISIVEIGKQILITRGSLTTFSIANDVSKYFAIIPAMFSIQYPMLNSLNIMHLTTPHSAILSAIIFNAIIIPALIPLALRGVEYKALKAEQLLYHNLLIYGIGGLLLPFIGVKLLDLLVVFLHLV